LNQKHKPFSRDKFRAAGCKQIPGPWLRLTGETATISTWKLIGNLTYSVPLSCCHMMMRARRGVAPHATIGSAHRFRAHGRFGMSLCGLVAILGNGSAHLLALSLRLSGCRFNRQKRQPHDGNKNDLGHLECARMWIVEHPTLEGRTRLQAGKEL
jgi:hypothetical protein